MAQGRRVRRVVRRIDTWSVLKVSSLFFFTFTLVVLLAGVLLWVAGSVFGAVDSVEDFMQTIGFTDFEFVGSQLLRGFVAAGLVIVLLGTGFSVLVSVVYNLISDLVGGIQMTVLEEDARLRSASAPAESGLDAGPSVATAAPPTEVGSPPVPSVPATTVAASSPMRAS
ncbi:MAG TPA: DUF3566 domain-containing protein [Acidimicrobiales bacterium]|nr:DUF3566 domain-containing protein [Acidimicrobiales bacterium]